MYRPTFDEFAVLARGATVVPVYRQLVGDTLTPVSAFCKIQEGEWSFLFESVVGGERVGRYSFLGSGPFLLFQAWDRQVNIRDRRTGQHQKLEHPDPLRLLEEHLARYRAPHVPGLPRFCGGAVGYAGYDTVRYVERLEHPPHDDRGLPDRRHQRRHGYLGAAPPGRHRPSPVRESARHQSNAKSCPPCAEEDVFGPETGPDITLLLTGQSAEQPQPTNWHQ